MSISWTTLGGNDGHRKQILESTILIQEFGVPAIKNLFLARGIFWIVKFANGLR